jgi:DNA-binding PadR family transcriptional regulator
MSHIYTLLKRLEATGQVRSEKQIQHNRPPRRVYAITQKGRELFLDWLSKPVREIRELRLQFPAKLFLIRFLEISDPAELIAKQVRVCQVELTRNRKQYDLCGDDFGRLVYRFRIQQIEAMLAWLEGCKTYGQKAASEKQHPGRGKHERV